MKDWLCIHQPPLHRRLEDAGAGLLELGLDYFKLMNTGIEPLD
jgi:hypothetical protein